MTQTTTSDITVTENAFKRVNELKNLEKNSNLMLRISVDGGGCSGFKYKYNLTEATEEGDLIMELEGTKILIDAISQGFMKNCVIDFIEELGESYFSIKNPNATSKCGCGSSFSI